MDVGLKVEGHREFVRELKKASYTFGKRVRVANLDVARTVARDARSTAAGQGGVAAKTGPSLRPGASQNSAYVKLGGARYPFAMGAEFGGGKYTFANPRPATGGTTAQFKPWRGNKSDAGYFLYPTIRQLGASGELENAYVKAIDEAVKEAFPG